MDSVGSNTITKGIILAGGFGTRLQSVVSDKPKSLAEVSGRPFIEYQLEWLMQQGIRDVTLAVHHMASQLQTFTEQWSNEKLRLHTVYEQDPLGTGGALVNVIQQRKMIGKVLVINGDTLFKFSLKPAVELSQSNVEPVILIASEIQDVSRFGTITMKDIYVNSFHQATGEHKSGIVNSGAYIVDSDFFMKKEIHPFSLEHDLFPKLAYKRKLLAYVVDSTEGFFDIGTPDSYREICKNSRC
jgi:D-glycero-alpha-D-manno-heptose 1-phosphate guanylyltransferase